MTELLIGIMYFLFGYFFSRFFLSNKFNHLIFMSSLPLGMAVWALLVAICLIVSIPVKIFLFYFYSISIIPIFIFNHLKITPISKNEFKNISIYIFFFAILFFIIKKLSFIHFSGDSLYLNHMGTQIGFHGKITNEMRMSSHLIGYPIFLPALQAALTFFNIDYPVALISLNIINIILFLTYYSYNEFHNNGFKRISSILISFVLFFMLITSPSFLFHFNYYNGHGFYASFILFFCIYSLEFQKKFTFSLLIISLIFLLGSTLARLESPVLSIFLISVFWLYRGLGFTKKINNLVIIYSIFTFIWIFFISSGNNPSIRPVILKPNFAKILQFLVLSFPIILHFKKITIIRLFITNLTRLIWFSLISAFIFFMTVKFTHTTNNIKTIINNLLFLPFHDSIWWFVIISVLFFSFRNFNNIRNSFTHENLLKNFFLLYILLIIILGSMRIPYRESLYDSGYRMLFHILPISIAWVIFQFKTILNRQIREMETLQ